jgi:putative spermidine/putrescine transport system substrate-binding protein
MTRRLLFALALLLIAVVAALWWQSRPAPILTVTSWAGPYGRAQASAMLRPYGAEKSVDVRIAQWDGDLTEVETAVNSRKYKGDVIDFELPKAVQACRDHLLEKIDPAMLPDGADGKPARADFVPGAIGSCWVASVAYAQVMVAAPGLKRVPATLVNFFDTRKFPGRRALPRGTAKYNLEMALLADGVAPSDVYKTLATPEGLDRAFAKLKALDPIWAHDSVDALRWVKNGRAVMAAALNGDIHDMAQTGFSPRIIWDHALYEFDVFAIPSGDPNAKRARDFIAWATGSAPLAGVAAWVPYGPARRSSFASLRPNPETGASMRPWLPTAPEHFAHAFAIDEDWWLDHQAAIQDRWQAFVTSR